MQTTTEDIIATGKRRGGLAAKLAAELESTRRQLEDAIGRTGPEYLADIDVQLAGWLAGVAADHPRLEEPTQPLEWPAAARRELGVLIAQCRGVDRQFGQERRRAEQLQIHAQIHALCEEHGCGPELADAIILEDDDHTWRRLYAPGTVR